MLTVTDFAQSSLDALTSSPTAPATLSAALIPLLQAKALDGVNFDFEGEGSGDQAGPHQPHHVGGRHAAAADPHWQITMDTYASSAGDPNGFYNIAALAPAVDAFFVMDYELNLAGSPSASSPLTSGQFSSQTTLAQYTAAVPGVQGDPRRALLRDRLADQTTGPWRPTPPAARPTSPIRRPRATGPSTGTPSPTPRGPATRWAASGTSRTTRERTASTTSRCWRRTTACAASGSGRSGWRATTRR